MICDSCEKLKKCKLISKKTIYVYYCNKYTGEKDKEEYFKNYMKIMGFSNLDLFEQLEVGHKLTIRLENNFGIGYFEKVRYMGSIKEDGYINKSGAWSLYKIPGTLTKCYSALFKPYRKKKTARIKINFDIKDIVKLGW